jgi:phosphoribosylaminoimidazole (AIR) synthetase
MAVMVAASAAQRAAAELRTAGETVYEIGTVEEFSGEPQAVIV